MKRLAICMLALGIVISGPALAVKAVCKNCTIYPDGRHVCEECTFEF